ncbi:MAG: hypothetical protein ACLQFR_18500 [Streptosporangiaceae bacterium]
MSTTQVRQESETRLGAGAWTGRILAGTLMIISGVLSFLVGLAAITRAAFFHATVTYPYHWSVHGWGWAQLILGIVVFAAGVCVFSGMLWARIVGVILAVLSALGSFLFVPYQPLWSIIVIALDGFMIWALMTSGRPVTQ